MVDKKDVELELEMLQNRDESYLFSNGDTEVFIPKSLIKSLDEIEDDLYAVIIPEWLAIEKGLI